MADYLFSYRYQRSEYSVVIPADTLEEAKGRMEAIGKDHVYDGKLYAEIPVYVPGSGLFSRLYTWLRNL